MTNQADFLAPWSKHIFLAVALLQVTLVIAVWPTLRRLRGGLRPTTAGWAFLSTATVVDLVAAVLVFIVLPAVSDAVVSEVMELPDYRILLSAIIAVVGWGIVRTILAANLLRSAWSADPSTDRA